MKKIFNIFINVLIWIIIFLAVLLTIICLTSRRNGISDIFGYVPIIIDYDSMSPTLKKGDFILSKKYKEEDLIKGDVISFVTTFNDKSIILTHRIDEVIPDGGYKTKGDNNEGFDEYTIRKVDIIGIYNGFRIPLFGYLINFLKSGVGFFLIIVLPLASYMIYQLYHIINMLLEKNSL